MHNQTRFGRYEVVSVLGQGAMGAVYKAVDPLIERAVAIKTISLNLSKEERAEFEERFYREAKSAGRLSHANIVTIYDVGEADDIAYIAMEYLEGESLREMLDSGVVLPVKLIGRIAARIANALNYAHENHVVHRDIKPANIMITPGRDVKIMDFGIAQIPTGSRTQLGTVLGSPKYMAPEQVTGQPTDGRTDIFALGVVLYEMLTGTTPFNGDNLSAIMYKILHEEPAPPSTINPRVPPGFDRIISRALSKRPEDRYQTALEFARDLRNQDASLPQEGRRPAAGNAPPKTVKASGTATGQQDATLLLPPHKAQGVIAIPPAGNGERIREKIAFLLGMAQQGRKPLFLAIPLLIIAAFVMVSQGRQPHSDESAASRATPTVSSAPGAPVSDAPGVRTSEGVPSPVSATPEKATLTFAISPWGEVYVDGKRAGVSPPLATLQLESGTHRVEIRNQAFAPYRDTVNVGPGKSIKIRHKFR
ncbi:MAG: serine/threonine-protein kinase [Thiobacillus sp.]